MTNIKTWFKAWVAIAILGCGIAIGYKIRPIFDPYPVSHNHTEYVVDSQWYPIHDYKPWIISVQTTDSVPYPVPANVDTAAILRKFYTEYTYEWDRNSKDTINIHGITKVTQNKITSNKLKYKWLLPTTVNNTVVDNTVTYNSYLQLGFNWPIYSTVDSNKFNHINDISLDLSYIFKKGSVGVIWQPMSNTYGFRGSMTLFKFKQRK
jgi:hypothetical protein